MSSKSSLRKQIKSEHNFIKKNIPQICGKDAPNVKLNDFKRSAIKFTGDLKAVKQTKDERKLQKEFSGLQFRIPIKKLIGCQAHINRQVVEKKTKTIKKKGVSSIPIPLVEIVRGKWRVTDGYHGIETLHKLGRKSVVVEISL